ncbi:MAG: hypothetical protein A3H49_08685 [Nitrospirae bacterium RIFCSPLOWO2_02_FULL_62_14]|nr:MAG: hypothetical protein A3H49_08685 [Nitrospirae bacterium RIFCSPLOWO2_02_FULL_62_14]
MAKLTHEQIEEIKSYLNVGKELPDDYKYLLFPPEKSECDLVYKSKERVEDVLSETWSVPLQPIRTFNLPKGKPAPEWSNRLIFGDNLQVMKRLLDDPQIKGQVKLVYIDPPFATKQEFQGSHEQKAYQDKIAGAEFIEFLRKRLIFLKKLLHREGSIFVHLDQRKAHYIKIVLDEVFGEENFRNEITLPGRASKNLQQQFDTITRLNVRHDTLFWYSSSSATRFSQLWIEKHNAGNPEGHWHHFWSTANRPSMRYRLFGHKPTTGQWTWKEERAKQAAQNHERYFREGGGRTLAEYWRDTGCALEFIRKDPEDGKPQYWRSPAETRLADTVWAGVPIYDNSTKYPTEKNEALLAQIIELASKKDDIVLDAFAGSGTTCAVAEKLGRQWIGIDCGKLAIYTVQKRLLNLTSKIGSKGRPLSAKPFTLFNAGLYDFARVRDLPWEDYRLFALQLFQIRDEPHKLAGIQLDGYKATNDALVFNFKEKEGVQLDEGFVVDLHRHLGGKARKEFFIVAPAACVTFLEDYIDRDKTRYYILRIPYSIIDELHDRPFQEIRQPVDETHVNDIVDAVGFDFIQPPTLEAKYVLSKSKNDLISLATIKISRFESHAMTKNPREFKNRETLSMVMVDYDYKGNGDGIFNLDAVFYRDQLEEHGWEVRLNSRLFGKKIMIIYIDIFGNELREIKTPADFGIKNHTRLKDAKTNE